MQPGTSHECCWCLLNLTDIVAFVTHSIRLVMQASIQGASAASHAAGASRSLIWSADMGVCRLMYS